ncbi:MAG: hypothetical protein COB67_02910 [SAR324 cluster bacterium]|uniref:Thioredoxin domain-containing protein n=1 Tax=SAR324 cluster bacterium TaxID=2024889 RepID=A0A2A4T943_9DELT|nr:MAG: hypothetical protein COB67_02910 [SAR324 cluster bacterium]
MLSKIKYGVAAVLILLFFSSTLSAAKLKVGDQAPQLIGKKAIGRGILKLSNLKREVGYEKDAQGRFVEVRGKYVLKIKKNIVVLNFFSTTCIPCIREIPTYNRVAKYFEQEAVKLIYVNVDAYATPQILKKFIIRRKIETPMMLPNQREAMRKYDVRSLPRMVIINAQGKVEKILIGFSENLEQELMDMISALLKAGQQ